MIALLLATPGVTHASYGISRSGTPVDRYVLTNAHGASVAILTLGGTVDEIRVPDRKGRLGNVVLRLPDATAHEARANFGAIVGRYANRIGGGGFTLDGKRYSLSANPTATVSHGGTPNFSVMVWDAQPCRSNGCTSVTLHHVSPDGFNGFPGQLDVAVTYTLTSDNALRIDYRATTDRPTVINLTNHSYFNLAGTGTILDQRLSVAATRYAPLNAHKLPTGVLASVAGTPFDLTRPVALGERVTAPAVAPGFDASWMLDKPAGQLALAARLYDPASGRTLTVETTEPTLLAYTANGFDGSLQGANGPIVRYAGVALETQHFPDSPNRPEFPSTVLRPGELFRSTTIYRFGTDKAR